jgi:glucosamine kinase
MFGIKVVSMQLSASSVYRTHTPRSGHAVRHWVGVDGGGTGTRAVIADARGRLLGQGAAGPSALGQGAVQAWRHIGEAAAAAAAQASLVDFDLADCALGLGLSGVSLAGEREALLAQAPALAELALISDGLAAVLGAHGGQPGAIVIAGTGSVGEALSADGEHREVGGWGWQLGDEGSGAWLGRRAIQHAQAALDSREPAGALAHAVWATAGRDRSALLAWCAQAGQAGFASLAPAVFEHEAADPSAARLLQQAVGELETLATALDPEARLPLALAGSIALRLADRLSPRWRQRLVPAHADAAVGALLLIRHLHPPLPETAP